MIGIVKNNVQIQAKDIMAVENINRLNDMNVNSCLFCNLIDPNFPLPLNTTVLQKAQVLDFNGPIITDHLSIAQDFINLPYASRRYIYLYDLDWKYIDNFSFMHVAPLFFHEKIDLIVRSESHYDLVKKLFKEPCCIMKEWDCKILKELDNDAKE